MSKMLKSPAKYVQGRNILKELNRYITELGSHLMIVQTEGGCRRYKALLDTVFADSSYVIEYEVFSGEPTLAKCRALAEKCVRMGITGVIGIGGGKVLDTVKGISFFSELPDAIIPTACSSDAPCSSVSVMYDDDGVFDQYLFLKASPNVVIVDTDVISKAPVRLLVAGMGDAMATWFEARACRQSGSNNQLGEKPTRAATELAALCWKYLKADGLKAKMAVDAKVVTEALENIIETNTYLSSVGFESGGLAAAHGIQKGFTVVAALRKNYHGENVAFCTITQLVLENAPMDELNEVISFCRSVGLPTTFSDLGCPDITREELSAIAEKACVEKSTIHNLPFHVTCEMVVDALLAADVLGKMERCQVV